MIESSILCEPFGNEVKGFVDLSEPIFMISNLFFQYHHLPILELGIGLIIDRVVGVKKLRLGVGFVVIHDLVAGEVIHVDDDAVSFLL